MKEFLKKSKKKKKLLDNHEYTWYIRNTSSEKPVLNYVQIDVKKTFKKIKKVVDIVNII